MIRRVKELVYHRFLLPTVERLATKTAVLDGEFTATFAEHRDRVCQLVDGMAAELGVGRGDRFAVMALNGHQFLELYHASFLGGSVINPSTCAWPPRSWRSSSRTPAAGSASPTPSSPP